MSHNQLPRHLKRIRTIVMTAFYGLIVLFLYNSVSITTRTGVTTLVIWFIQVAPLIIFIPVLHRNYLRGYAWLSFVSLIYFTHGVVIAFTVDRLVPGLLEVFLCCVLFSGILVFIRKYRSHYQVSV